MKKKIVDETFAKVNWMKECQDDSTLFFAYEKIGIEGSHPFSYGGAKDLVDVCVNEIEGAMFKNEIQDCVNYMGRWAACGQEMLLFLHEMNDGCYAIIMLNYCIQGCDISCDQCIGWEWWKIFSEVEEIFCVFNV